MNNNKIRSADKIIKASAVLRLFIDALTALLLAYSCSKNILLQVHEFGIFYLLLIIFFLLVDMISAILWQFVRQLIDIHCTFYIIFGEFFYAIYFGLVFADAKAVERTGFDALCVKFPMLHVIGYYLIGLIPFIIYLIGKKILKKANRKQLMQFIESAGDEDD